MKRMGRLAKTAFVALAVFAAPLASIAQPAKRDVVLLIDNHIFTHKPFKFDEAVLRQSIRAMLEHVRPERVVVFAVGHDGHAQYPSKFFPEQKASPGFPLLQGPTQDLLQIWREETARTRTGMIVYVSTLRNDALQDSHPEYFRIFGNGVRATVIDHNSAYADEVLLPGLQEIIDRYNPDGFFLDGDYWTAHESWNPASTAGFVKETGLPVPTDYPQASYPPFVKYTYDSYRRDYVGKLEAFFDRQKRPLNWSINAAFTVRDPSPEPANYGTVAVDLPFFALGEAYIESLFSQRLKGGAEIVYPLFAQSEGAAPYQYKSKAQLKQELAVAVVNRSLVSFYLPLGYDGTIALDRIQPAIEVYDEFENHIGTQARPDQKLLAKIAIVNPNGDAIATRRFEELRKASLHLYETGVVHAITTETLAPSGGYTHFVFPRMNHAERPDLIPSLLKGGQRVLWAVNERAADEKTEAIIAALRSSLREVKADCADCEALRDSSGGEIWLVPAIDNATLDKFASTIDPAVTFPGKPEYVYALAYGDALKETIYLSSVAWGGYAFGRHTLFEDLEPTPSMSVRLKAPATCVQRTMGGDIKLPRGRELTLQPFDTITKVECDL